VPTRSPIRTPTASASHVAQTLDLNIERVLDHWPVAYVREVIANAIDEQLLTDTGAPDIAKVDKGE
jgi:hypothetical protein